MGREVKELPIWNVTFSQNGWEYTGHLRISASSVEQISEKAIRADGVLIELDEEIGKILRKG